MLDCVILFRVGKTVRIICDDKEDVAIFSSLPNAQGFAEKHPVLQKVPYQIVELDEL